MRHILSNFLERHYAVSKEPIYVVEIAFNDDATELLYLTSHPDVDTPDGETVIQNVVTSITSTSQKVNPVVARSTIGNIVLKAIDKDGAITTQFKAQEIADNGLRERRIRVYFAYKGMEWLQISKNLIQTQITGNIEFDEQEYTINCRDIQRTTRKDIFKLQSTKLTQSVSATQSLIPVLSIDGFERVAHGSSYTDSPNSTVGYIKINEEVIRYTGTTNDPTLGLCFVSNKRGALNTLAAIHEVDLDDTRDRGVDVDEFVYLEMPAVKMAYAIYTGILYGQGGATLPNGWHLSIPSDYIRLSNFENIGVDLWDTSSDQGFILRFAGEAKQDGKKFIETELLLPASVFPPIYSTGEIGLKRFANVVYDSPWVYELNKNNIVRSSALVFNSDDMRNLLSIEWNYDHIREKLTRQKLVVDTNSIATYGLTKGKTLKFKGLHGSRHTTAVVERLFDRLRDRNSAPPAEMSVVCLPNTNHLEVGDIVRVKIDSKTDYFQSGPLNRSFEIQSSTINWITGRVMFDLFGSTGYATDIAPSDPGDSSTQILPNAWYQSAGIDLDSVLTINDIGGVGHIETDQSLSGGNTLAAGIYYYLGDLELDPGVTLTIDDNIQLRVMGNFQINGTIDGAENGLGGGKEPYNTAAEDDNPDDLLPVLAGESGVHTPGQPGYIGPTMAAGYLSSQFTSQTHTNTIIDGQVQSVPPLDVFYDGSDLIGLPSVLWGTSGTSGGNTVQVNSGPSYNYSYGGEGGNGGAGLAIISRGVSFGVSGLIVTDGQNGELGEENSQVDDDGNNRRLVAGTGAGGAPGAVLFVIDGLNNSVPSLQNVQASYGSTDIPSDVYVMQNPSGAYAQLGRESIPTDSKIYGYYYGFVPTPNLSGFNGGSRVIFIPPYESPVEDEVVGSVVKLSPITGLSLYSGTDALLPAVDGSIRERIRVTFDEETSILVEGFEIQIKNSSETNWETVRLIRSSDAPIAFIDAVGGVDYDIRVRSYGNGTLTDPSDWVTVLNHIVVGKTEPPPDVVSVLVYQQPDGTREFNWNTSNKPIDFSGYELRWALGVESDWDLMTPLFYGLVSSPPFETNQLAAGNYTFAIKMEDRSGNQSVNAAFITSNLGDPRTPTVFATIRSHNSGWPGTKTDCSVDDVGYLVANSDGTFDWDDAELLTWNEWESEQWNSPGVSPIVYQEETIDIGAIAVFMPLVTVGAVGVQNIEVRISDDDISYDSWHAPVGAESGRYVQVRCTLTEETTELLYFTSMSIIISGETETEFISDASTSSWGGSAATGREIPIAKSYSIIFSIKVALQSVGAGWTWEILSKNNTTPMIRIYNGSGVASDATVDVEVIGYPS